jgi:hypothetical protein
MPDVNDGSRENYQTMPDQPDCCGKCGSRLALVEITYIDGEHVFLSRCGSCQRDVLIVED